MENLDGSVLVMAHPDDEMLWASSVLAGIERIVLCYEDAASFPELGEGRRRSLAAFPLPGVMSLGMTETETFGSAEWPEPVETDYGLAVRRWRGSLPNCSVAGYREGYGRLVDALRPLLEGKRIVFTHNPWGEYGHEDHVQVFRAVATLREQLGFELRVSSYVSDKSFGLMQRWLPRLDCGAPSLPTDTALATELQALYTANSCWTWFDDYVWPARECFYRVLGPGEAPVPPHAGSLINLVWTDWKRPTRPGIRRRIMRRILARR